MAEKRPLADADKRRLVEEQIVKYYTVETRHASRFLTDGLKRAFVAEAMYHVMLDHYEANGRDDPLGHPNLYVEAAMAAEKTLKLR